MEENTGYEREIDLIDLIFKVLHKWRGIFLIALVTSVLCGGYKLASEFNNLRDTHRIKSIEEAYEKDLSNYELSKASLETEIDNITVSIERQKEYNDNSLLMQINPFDKQIATISYYVDTNYQFAKNQDIDKTDMVISAYLTASQNGELFDYIKDNLTYDIKRKYLSELCTVTADFENNIITLEVVHENREECNEIFSLILKYIDNKKGSIDKAVSEHTLTIIDESRLASVDVNLDLSQKTNIQTVSTLEASLKEKQAAVNALTVPVLAALTKTLVIKSAIKYAVIGFVLGLFLAMFFFIFSCLLSNRLSKPNEIRQRYGIKLLGTIESESPKRILGFLDRWLCKLEGKSNNKSSYDEAVKKICTGIKAASKFDKELQGVKHIVITGSISNERIYQLTNDIQNAFEEGDYKFSSGSFINHSAETTEKVAGCDGVIVVEKVGESSFMNITNEFDNINDLEKKVIGAVILL